MFRFLLSNIFIILYEFFMIIRVGLGKLAQPPAVPPTQPLASPHA